MKRRILAIDDSKAIRYLLHTLLSKHFQVITAADGCSAINWLSQNELPDLIIADPQLPDMQNWELIEQLATSGMYGSIPIIVLSALNQTDTAAKCEELGLARFFTKPFNPVSLIDEVHQTFRQLDVVVEMSN
jgi:CheY-like chemotaxis protein